jgi:phospholipid/cholesterol/gamma-HCH transport system substrate-binding protein
MKQKRQLEIRVGAVIVFALAVIIGFVFTLGGDSNLFTRKVQYKILFRSTTGLYKGDPVLLTGVEVGNVKKIWFPSDLTEKKIYVEIDVDKTVSNRIRADSRASIGNASIVYGKVVELTIGSPEQSLIPGGGWIPVSEKTSIFAVMDSTQHFMGGLQSVINKIDQGEGMLGMMLNDPLELEQTLHHLSVSTKKLSLILERLEHGEGVGSLLSDSMEIKQSVTDLKRVIADLKMVSQALSSKKTAMGRLINDEQYGQAITQDLQSALHALANIAAKIDSGEGSVGLLINDPDLYMGLNDVVLGAQKSNLTKWVIQNRRKAGEKAREKAE